MYKFSDNCIDLSCSILEYSLASINKNGTIIPEKNEKKEITDSGYACYAIGLIYKLQKKNILSNYDLIRLASYCLNGEQLNFPINKYTSINNKKNKYFSLLGLICFGIDNQKNPLWNKLSYYLKKIIIKNIQEDENDNNIDIETIAKYIIRLRLGIDKGDKAEKLIALYFKNILKKNNQGFIDNNIRAGSYDISGIQSLSEIIQLLYLNGNSSLINKNLPIIRTFVEKYLYIIPNLVREDGLGWSYGPYSGIYGQVYLINIILESFSHRWIKKEEEYKYYKILKNLFQYFFLNYIDKNNGIVLVNNLERETDLEYTSRMINFDIARYLAYWSKVLKHFDLESISVPKDIKIKNNSNIAKLIFFEKAYKKEQWLFIYKDIHSKLCFNIPLISSSRLNICDSLAFPHSLEIFDYPVNKYLPIMIPELTIEKNIFIPSFFAQNTKCGKLLDNSFYLEYEQNEFIDYTQKFCQNIGYCKIKWVFSETKITSMYTFFVKKKVHLYRFRYFIGTSNTNKLFKNVFSIENSKINCTIINNDFNALSSRIMTNNQDYKTYYGKINLIQKFVRSHPMVMKPNYPYSFAVEIQPSFTMNQQIN